MSMKIFLGIFDDNKNTNIIDRISQALNEKYVECHIDYSEPLDAEELLEQNKYDLIIADTTVVRQSVIKTLNEMSCPFLYIAPELKVQLPKNMILMNGHQDILNWINQQKVTNEDLAKSLKNNTLMKKNVTTKKEVENREETIAVDKTDDFDEKQQVVTQSDVNHSMADQKQNKSHQATSQSTGKSSSDNKVSDKNRKELDELDIHSEQKPIYFDELYGEAIHLVLRERVASVKLLQETFKLSFAEGSELINMMEKDGVVSPFEKGKQREVLLDPIKTEDFAKNPMITGALEDDQSNYIGKQVSNTAFVTPTYNLHKTIGIWSPQGRTGATTLTMNLAMYLGKLKYNVAVLEGISNKQSLKLNLQRFTDIPEGWESWAKTLFKTEIDEKEALKVQWVYNNVSWLPLNGQDPALEWNYNKLFSYINNVKKYNLVFVDFPGGYMDEYSLYNLDYIDELWVVMDNNINQLKEIKKYIHGLVQEEEKREAIPMKLICNQDFPFSQSEDYGKVLEIPLLAAIPSLSIETQKNLFQRKPLIEYPEIKSKISPAFEKIRSELSVKPEEDAIRKKRPFLDKIIKHFIKN